MAKRFFIVRPLVVSVAVSFAAAPSFATCVLPQQVQLQMRAISTLPEGLARYNRGLTYYDFRCYAEAITELGEAVRVLSAIAKPAGRGHELLGLSRAALALSEAHVRLRTDRRAGIEQMLAVAERTMASLVKALATMDLVRLLDANAPEWVRVERELDTLSEMGYWQATKTVAHRKLARGEAAATYVEQRLAGANRVDEAHALRIVLADVWRASGRTLEAWLLIRTNEASAGDEILDAELRLEFLRVATAVARERGRAGDSDAARSVAVYEAALCQAEAQRP